MFWNVLMCCVFLRKENLCCGDCPITVCDSIVLGLSYSYPWHSYNMKLCHCYCLWVVNRAFVDPIMFTHTTLTKDITLLSKPIQGVESAFCRMLYGWTTRANACACIPIFLQKMAKYWKILRPLFAVYYTGRLHEQLHALAFPKF